MTHVFKSYIGEDTEVSVEFDYYPPQPDVVTPVTRMQQAIDEKCVIVSVHINGDEIMENLNEALRIMGGGLIVVFGVMGLITLLIWLSGRCFLAAAEKQKARERAEAEASEKEQG